MRKINIIKNSVFILLIAVVLSIVFNFPVFAALEDWKVELFAGPGVGDRIFTSVTTSDFRENGKKYIYGSAYTPPLSTDPNDITITRHIYEFKWNDNEKKWEQNIIDLPLTNVYFAPKTIRFRDARKDGVYRLYIVDTFGNIWECSIPPREERPPDPTGFNWGMNDPGAGGGKDPDNSNKPSIIGN